MSLDDNPADGAQYPYGGNSLAVSLICLKAIALTKAKVGMYNNM